LFLTVTVLGWIVCVLMAFAMCCTMACFLMVLLCPGLSLGGHEFAHTYYEYYRYARHFGEGGSRTLRLSPENAYQFDPDVIQGSPEEMGIRRPSRRPYLDLEVPLSDDDEVNQSSESEVRVVIDTDDESEVERMDAAAWRRRAAHDSSRHGAARAEAEAAWKGRCIGRDKSTLGC